MWWRVSLCVTVRCVTCGGSSAGVLWPHARDPVAQVRRQPRHQRRRQGQEAEENQVRHLVGGPGTTTRDLKRFDINRRKSMGFLYAQGVNTVSVERLVAARSVRPCARPLGLSVMSVCARAQLYCVVGATDTQLCVWYLSHVSKVIKCSAMQ